MLASHLHFDHAGGFTRARRVRRRSCRVSRSARYRQPRRVGGRDASARAEPRQLLCRRTSCRWGGRRAGFLSRRRSSRCPASACAGPAATPDSIRSSTSSRAGKTAVFAADLIPTTAHLDLPWIMGYDLYPMETLEFKRAFRPGSDRPRVPGVLRARSGGRGGIHPRRTERQTHSWRRSGGMSVQHRHHRRQRPLRHGGADRPGRADA